MRLLNLFFLLCFIPFSSQITKHHFRNKGFVNSNKGEYSLIKTFNENNGLCSNQVYDMVQDDEGFLWVATDNGVSRFDGVKFYNYSVSDGLPSNDVIQIFKDKKGKIWANSYMKPLAYFDSSRNRFIRYNFHENSFKGLRTYKYNSTKKTYVSKGTTDFVEVGDSIKISKQIAGFPIPNSDVFLKDFKFSNNILEIILLENRKLKSVKMPINYKPVYSFFHYNSLVFYGDKKWVNRFEVLKNATIRRDSIHVDDHIFQITFSKDYINIITKDNTIYTLNFDEFLTVEHKFTLPVIPNTLFMDRENNVWVGTLENGLYLYKKNPVISPKIKNLVNQNFQFIKFYGNDFYAGNYFGEIIKNDTKIFDIKTILTKLRNIRINNIIKTKKHDVIVSEHFVIKNYKKVIPIEQFGFSSIKSSVQKDDNSILLGTNNGLYTLDLSSDNIVKVGNNGYRIINLIKAGESFYFTTADEVYQYLPISGKILKQPFSNIFENDFITDLEYTEPGYLWTSTEKGIVYLFKHNKFLRKLDFNARKKVNIKSITVAENKLWVATSSNGVIKTDLNFNKSKIVSNPVYITSYNGLASDKTNSIYVKNGEAFVATKEGISIVPRNFLPKINISKPVILQTSIEGKTIPNSQNIHLDRKQQSVSFLISLIDFSGSTSKIQYATENDGIWTEINDNVLNVQVTGRSQHIYLRTLNRNNNMASDPIKINVSKTLNFYQYNEFWLLLGGLIFGSFVVFRSRKKLRNQQRIFEEELERRNTIKKERERISHDMHDDLGAGISALKLQAEFLKYKISDSDLKEDVNELLKTSEDMNISMREMLWNLDSGNDNLGDFMKYVIQYGEKFFIKTEIKFSSKIHKVNPQLEFSTEKRRNLYLSIKEAFNNCYKHSGAKTILIDFFQKEDMFEVIIKDDGEGFCFDQETDGNGLKNMKFRMEEIGGSFDILTTNIGSKLQFTVRI